MMMMMMMMVIRLRWLCLFALLCNCCDGGGCSTSSRTLHAAFLSHSKTHSCQASVATNGKKNFQPALLLLATVPTSTPTNQEKPLQKQQQQQSPPTISSRYLAVQALESAAREQSNQRKKDASSSSSSSLFALEQLERNPAYQQQTSTTATTLSIRDRSFARLLLTIVERRMGQLDAVIDYCSKEKKSDNINNNNKKGNRSNAPQRRVDVWVQMVLRVGAAQLLFLDVPAYAAVQETVQVLRMINHQEQQKSKRKTTTDTGGGTAVIPETRIKFVNAILRRIAREQDTSLEAAMADDPALNVAPWLAKRWNRDWGAAATSRIVHCAMTESNRCLTIKNVEPKEQQHQQRDRIEYLASLFENATILPQGSIQIGKPPAGPISSWPLYQEGAWWLQDPSATIPALALYKALLRLRRGDHDKTTTTTTTTRRKVVVDLCAAPGGKTAQLCNFGLDVIAVEKSPRRARRLQENQNRLGMDWEIVVADATQWVPNNDTVVSGILLDVPCTATGTGSKRPDVLRRDENCKDLLELQLRLAIHAVDHILPVGGILVYATCSLLKCESEDQVTKLLLQSSKSHSENDDRLNNSTTTTMRSRLETIPFEPGEIPGFDGAIDSNGWIRVLPGCPALDKDLQQCDGFFVARLKKIS